MRENSFLTHKSTGVFYYSFSYHRLPSHKTGKGEKYRATVQGPGVAPYAFWESPAPGPYNKAVDDAANQLQQTQLQGDPRCTIN